LTLLDAHAAVGFLDPCAGRDPRLMDAETDHAFVQR
jgi:hypothetical protein